MSYSSFGPSVEGVGTTSIPPHTWSRP